MFLTSLPTQSSARKLTLPGPLSEALEAAGFSPLSIFPDHAEVAAALPAHHRDPFDRMLVAQAQMELLTLVSDDVQLLSYDVTVVTASD